MAAHCSIHFLAAGDPAEAASGKLTLEVIREELGRVIRERAVDDPSLCYLDGRELYGEQGAVRLPLPDELHPDAETHRLIGERFASRGFNAGGPFGASIPAPR